jgi:glycosyltransferase involved in cell wall biosynthesis
VVVGLDITPALIGRSGVGRFALETFRALQRSPMVDVEPLALTARRPSSHLSRLVQGIAREALYYPLVLSRMARVRQVDLVHCPAPFSPRVSDRPLVLTVHDALPYRHPELFPPTIALHSRWFVGPALRRATRIVASSRHTRTEIINLFDLPPERVAVAPPGVDSRFRPTPADAAWLRSRLGIEGRFVLCVGTLEPRKNLKAALQAFEIVAEEFADCSLVIAGGTGWKNSAFESHLRHARARVVLAGYVNDDELIALYSSAACFLFPSLYEGYGMPVLEAMACGAPVVASDRPSLPEAVDDAGVLVDPTRPEVIADAVSSVLRSDRLAAELRTRGLERSRRATWDACVEKTVAAYREALEETAA